MKKLFILILLMLSFANQAAAQCVVGEVKHFAMSWCPRDFITAHGQTLAISDFQVLYSLLGNQFGGDGRTYFNLPDLRGRVIVGAGHGIGLSERRIGQKGGLESVPLAAENIPPHSHSIRASSGRAKTSYPGNSVLAKSGTYTSGTPDTTLSPQTVAPSHNMATQPVPVMQPYQAILPCICAQGIYPSRG